LTDFKPQVEFIKNLLDYLSDDMQCEIIVKSGMATNDLKQYHLANDIYNRSKELSRLILIK
jgi:hypothetical protein